MGRLDLWTGNVRPAAATPEAAVVDAAAQGFHRAFPDRSAKIVLTRGQVAVGLALLSGAAGWTWFDAPHAWATTHVLAYVLFAGVIAVRLAAAVGAPPLQSRLFAPSWNQHWPTYTVLCPLHREADVVFDLVAAINRLDYPKEQLDVQLLVEADDPDTIAAAALVAAGAAHVEVVIVPPAAPRTKPKALNVGLMRARGDFLVVYDAEDRPHPAQLRAALAAFAKGGPPLACVQAPLVADNGSAAWIARQFAAEYAIQFHVTLPFLAAVGLPLPLGGTSNHFRIAALRELGGWDPYNVTEDADLGYRLARRRMQAGVIAPPTWEEAPISMGAWLKQRTRWIKGHLHTWLVLMRDPLRTARAMGWRNWLSIQLVLGGGVAAAMAHAPLLALLALTLLTNAKALTPADLGLVLMGYLSAALAGVKAWRRTGDAHHARATLSMPFYWPLASLAACLALIELALKPHHWAKTKHGVSPRARFPFVQTMSFNSAQKESTSASG